MISALSLDNIQTVPHSKSSVGEIDCKMSSRNLGYKHGEHTMTVWVLFHADEGIRAIRDSCRKLELCIQAPRERLVNRENIDDRSVGLFCSK